MSSDAKPISGSRLYALDSLRAIAAIAVVVLDVSFYTGRAEAPWSFGDGALQALRLGVPLLRAVRLPAVPALGRGCPR
jgi:peptidoglycan/LPS O-acetylase OafA/YrhL